MGSSFRWIAALILIAGLSGCSSTVHHSIQNQDRVAALFVEAQFSSRCFSVIEPEPNQFITVDLAKTEKANEIETLEDCAAISARSQKEIGSYVSNATRVASSGMAPSERFEFNPNRWPVEFHYNRKVYHIYQGKVLSVE